MNNVRILAMSLLMIGLLVGCASTRPAGEQFDDAAITAKVKAKLAADPEINPFKIDVDTREGVVRLNGVVEKPEARREAIQLAQNTKGVVRVVDNIEIGERKMGDKLDDAAITAKVKAKLAADPEINPFNIDVDTRDGVVRLHGRVKDMAHKMEAGKLAANTKGVREVENHLAVGDRSEKSGS